MNQARRILFVQHESDMYGSSRAMLRIISKLDASRYQPIVLIPNDGPLASELRSAHIQVIFHPRLSYLKRTLFINPLALLRWLLQLPPDVFGLIQIIRNFEIDLVHSNSSIIFSPAIAARISNIPHIFHIRELLTDFPIIWKFYMHYIRFFSRAIIAISKSAAAQNQCQHVEVIYDGYELTEMTFPKDAVCKIQQDFKLQDSFIVVCVGRIKLRNKGQDFLVSAIKLLKDHNLPVKCLIVGNPHPSNANHLTKLKKIIRLYHLENDVFLIGEMENPYPAYAASNVFVLPSCRPEGLGNVGLEAMAFRLPVIVTNLGGAPEMVDENVTGFVVDPYDVEQLADKIEFLYRNPAIARQMGEAGRLKLEKKFDLKTAIERTMAIYDSLLGIPLKKS